MYGLLAATLSPARARAGPHIENGRLSLCLCLDAARTFKNTLCGFPIISSTDGLRFPIGLSKIHGLRIPDYFIQRWTPVSDFVFFKNVDLRIPEYFIQRWAPVSNWSVKNTLVQIPDYFIQRWTPISDSFFQKV